jgi:hypothetical protein
MYKTRVTSRLVILPAVSLALLPFSTPTLARDGVTPIAVALDAAPSARELLAASDAARGGDNDGLALRSTVTSYRGNEARKSYTLSIEADRLNSVAMFVEPARSKGLKMLVQERNMWFLSPELAKPVPISPRQRLLGEASNGDIATTNYSRDYDATILGEAPIDEASCYVLALKAKEKDVTYDKIVYYIDKKSKLGLKAEYYTLSDKLLKTAAFQYDNTLLSEGKTLPFVSRMEIVDALNAEDKTIIAYSDVQSKKIPPSQFNMRLLMQN